MRSGGQSRKCWGADGPLVIVNPHMRPLHPRPRLQVTASLLQSWKCAVGLIYGGGGGYCQVHMRSAHATCVRLGILCPGVRAALCSQCPPRPVGHWSALWASGAAEHASQVHALPRAEERIVQVRSVCHCLRVLRWASMLPGNGLPCRSPLPFPLPLRRSLLLACTGRTLPDTLHAHLSCPFLSIRVRPVNAMGPQAGIHFVQFFHTNSQSCIRSSFTRGPCHTLRRSRCSSVLGSQTGLRVGYSVYSAARML